MRLVRGGGACVRQLGVRGRSCRVSKVFYIRAVCYNGACKFTNNCFLLWLIVRCATTSYSLEWIGGDGRAWEEMRELPVENGGRLFVKLDYLNYKRKDRYAITIECGRDSF